MRTMILQLKIAGDLNYSDVEKLITLPVGIYATICKLFSIPYDNNNICVVNSKSYLQHEFEQAVKCSKKILIFYNSKYKMQNWLPAYMEDYEYIAQPFWTENMWGNKVGNYQYLKQELL